MRRKSSLFEGERFWAETCKKQLRTKTDVSEKNESWRDELTKSERDEKHKTQELNVENLMHKEHMHYEKDAAKKVEEESNKFARFERQEMRC